ncbi:MAG: hypothetical protein KGI00_04980, partial [Candidatus Micrarchaeota archaeon]|nr:hypothetical protein [Candidatus Micrarchaeota archaeon]
MAYGLDPAATTAPANAGETDMSILNDPTLDPYAQQAQTQAQAAPQLTSLQTALDILNQPIQPSADPTAVMQQQVSNQFMDLYQQFAAQDAANAAGTQQITAAAAQAPQPQSPDTLEEIPLVGADNTAAANAATDNTVPTTAAPSVPATTTPTATPTLTPQQQQILAAMKARGMSPEQIALEAQTMTQPVEQVAKQNPAQPSGAIGGLLNTLHKIGTAEDLVLNGNLFKQNPLTSLKQLGTGLESVPGFYAQAIEALPTGNVSTGGPLGLKWERGPGTLGEYLNQLPGYISVPAHLAIGSVPYLPLAPAAAAMGIAPGVLDALFGLQSGVMGKEILQDWKEGKLTGKQAITQALETIGPQVLGSVAGHVFKRGPTEGAVTEEGAPTTSTLHPAAEIVDHASPVDAFTQPALERSLAEAGLPTDSVRGSYNDVLTALQAAGKTPEEIRSIFAGAGVDGITLPDGSVAITSEHVAQSQPDTHAELVGQAAKNIQERQAGITELPQTKVDQTLGKHVAVTLAGDKLDWRETPDGAHLVDIRAITPRQGVGTALFNWLKTRVAALKGPDSTITGDLITPEAVYYRARQPGTVFYDGQGREITADEALDLVNQHQQVSASTPVTPPQPLVATGERGSLRLGKGEEEPVKPQVEPVAESVPTAEEAVKPPVTEPVTATEPATVKPTVPDHVLEEQARSGDPVAHEELVKRGQAIESIASQQEKAATTPITVSDLTKTPDEIAAETTPTEPTPDTMTTAMHVLTSGESTPIAHPSYLDEEGETMGYTSLIQQQMKELPKLPRIGERARAVDSGDIGSVVAVNKTNRTVTVEYSDGRTETIPAERTIVTMKVRGSGTAPPSITTTLSDGSSNTSLPIPVEMTGFQKLVRHVVRLLGGEFDPKAIVQRKLKVSRLFAADHSEAFIKGSQLRDDYYALDQAIRDGSSMAIPELIPGAAASRGNPTFTSDIEAFYKQAIKEKDFDALMHSAYLHPELYRLSPEQIKWLRKAEAIIGDAQLRNQQAGVKHGISKDDLDAKGNPRYFPRVTVSRDGDLAVDAARFQKSRSAGSFERYYLDGNRVTDPGHAVQYFLESAANARILPRITQEFRMLGNFDGKGKAMILAKPGAEGTEGYIKIEGISGLPDRRGRVVLARKGIVSESLRSVTSRGLGDIGRTLILPSKFIRAIQFSFGPFHAMYMNAALLADNAKLLPKTLYTEIRGTYIPKINESAPEFRRHQIQNIGSNQQLLALKGSLIDFSGNPRGVARAELEATLNPLEYAERQATGLDKIPVAGALGKANREWMFNWIVPWVQHQMSWGRLRDWMIKNPKLIPDNFEEVMRSGRLTEQKRMLDANPAFAKAVEEAARHGNQVAGFSESTLSTGEKQVLGGIINTPTITRAVVNNIRDLFSAPGSLRGTFARQYWRNAAVMMSSIAVGGTVLAFGGDVQAAEQAGYLDPTSKKFVLNPLNPSYFLSVGTPNGTRYSLMPSPMRSPLKALFSGAGAVGNDLVQGGHSPFEIFNDGLAAESTAGLQFVQNRLAAPMRYAKEVVEQEGQGVGHKQALINAAERTSSSNVPIPAE